LTREEDGALSVEEGLEGAGVRCEVAHAGQGAFTLPLPAPGTPGNPRDCVRRTLESRKADGAGSVLEPAPLGVNLRPGRLVGAELGVHHVVLLRGGLAAGGIRVRGPAGSAGLAALRAGRPVHLPGRLVAGPLERP